MIAYGHDDSITEPLSAACDMRVIWGGDAAVAMIRRHLLPPLARELTFPDRSSFAAISVASWQAADATARLAAVGGFATDVYWFDQAACSSPRVLGLVGDAVAVGRARVEFSELLAAVLLERGWQVDAAMAVEKHVSSYGLAAAGTADGARFKGNDNADHQ